MRKQILFLEKKGGGVQDRWQEKNSTRKGREPEKAIQGNRKKKGKRPSPCRGAGKASAERIERPGEGR